MLAEATHVVAATEGTAAWLALADPSIRARSSVIPNGYEAEDWAGISPHRFDRFTVLHAGRLSGDRDLQGFLGGFQMFLGQDAERRARTQLVLIGPHDEGPVRQVRQHGLEGVVRFLGQVPHKEAMEMEAGAHVLLLIKHRDPQFRELIPGKLYEYLGARKPILAVAGQSPAAELVRGLRAGWVASPDSPELVALALEEAYGGRSPRARAEDCALFTRASLTGRLAHILDSLP